jgi:TRAP-type C4-dicarboxylate transport system substrate-binding protein
MKKTIFRGLILSATIGACASMFSAAPAVAAPLTLKISHQFPANTDFRDQVARKFAAEVEKQTNGAIKFQIYPGASLFKANQQFEAMSNGSLDMSVYPLAYSGC